MLNKLLKKIDGWKTILSYILAQVFGSYPLVLSAIEELLADPRNSQKQINLLIQIGIALGLGHKIFKNLNSSSFKK